MELLLNQYHMDLISVRNYVHEKILEVGRVVEILDTRSNSKKD